MKQVLVVGGAGYIGSHLAYLLCRSGYEVVVLDNLSTGYRDVVLQASFVQGDIGDSAFLRQLFARHAFEAVFHFASYIQVGESVIKICSSFRRKKSFIFRRHRLLLARYRIMVKRNMRFNVLLKRKTSPS